MKILHITNNYRPDEVGGAEVVVYNLSLFQAAEGHTPHVAHLSPRPGESYVDGDVRVHPLKARNLFRTNAHHKQSKLMRNLDKYSTYYNLAVLSEIEAIIQAERPDIVHTHSLVDISTWVWARARRCGARTIHTLHDYDLACARATLYRDEEICGQREPACKVHSFIKRSAIGSLDRVVSISQKTLDLHSGHGVLPDRLLQTARVIWNGMPDISLRTRSTQRSGDLRIGFIGRLVQEKGVGLMLDACRALPPHGWTLDIAGKAPVDDAWIRKKAEGLPVRMRGWVDSAAFLEDIDVLVVPSLWDEPFGLTVIEGAASGSIVVGSDRGAIPEILKHAPNGHVFNASEPASLARLLTQVMKDDQAQPARIDAPSEANFADRISMKRMYDAYQDVYESVLQG